MNWNVGGWERFNGNSEMGPGWNEDGTYGPLHRTWQDNSNSWKYQYWALHNQEDQKNCICWYYVPGKLFNQSRRLCLCHQSIFFKTRVVGIIIGKKIQVALHHLAKMIFRRI